MFSWGDYEINVWHSHFCNLDQARNRHRPIPPRKRGCSAQKSVANIYIRDFVHTNSLCEVLQRNLPEYYQYNNAYTYFLFSTPSSFDRVAIEKSGLTFEKPPDRRIHTLSDITAVQHVFKRPELYHALYADSLSKVTNDYG